MMNLAITNEARKTLTGLQPKQFKQIAMSVFGLLGNPVPHDSVLLKGSTHGERRIDVGEYRVVYTFNDDTVHVLVIAKRNDDEVYRIWRRTK